MIRNIFNLSYQRAVVPDYYGFFDLFYKNLTGKNPVIANMFKNTNMKKQEELLMQSITYMTSFSATLEPPEELDFIAKLHGKDNLNIPSEYFDTWLDSLIETVRIKDPDFDENVDRAWRTIMAPGIEYMKSFCSVNS
jgi:hemoglobin-like flavoprotein